MLVLKNVGKHYGKVKVLAEVSIQVDPGEFVCLTGKSGAGKSTLIHLLTGAEAVSVGSIEVDGVDLRNVPPPVMQLYRRRIGVVFQDYKLLPQMTVAENIAFPLEVCGVADAVIAKRVSELLKTLELTKHAKSLPRALSGGEKARVAIARAIAHSPIILLADEPTGNLDPEQSAHILKIFSEINQGGTTVILATHDTALVDTKSARIIRIDDGRITSDSASGRTKKSETKKASMHMLDAQKTSGTSPKRKVRVTAINA